MDEKAVYCDFHPGIEARWYCTDCGHYLCDECVESRRLSRRFTARIHADPRCRGRCIPVDQALKTAAQYRDRKLPEEHIEGKEATTPSFYLWRRIMGQSAVAGAFLIVYLSKPLLLPLSDFLYFILIGMLLYGLWSCKMWAAKVTLWVLLFQTFCLAIQARGTDEVHFFFSWSPAFIASALCLTLFTIALHEFHKT